MRTVEPAQRRRRPCRFIVVQSHRRQPSRLRRRRRQPGRPRTRSPGCRSPVTPRRQLAPASLSAVPLLFSDLAAGDRFPLGHRPGWLPQGVGRGRHDTTTPRPLDVIRLLPQPARPRSTRWPGGQGGRCVTGLAVFWLLRWSSLRHSAGFSRPSRYCRPRTAQRQLPVTPLSTVHCGGVVPVSVVRCATVGVVQQAAVSQGSLVHSSNRKPRH